MYNLRDKRVPNDLRSFFAMILNKNNPRSALYQDGSYLRPGRGLFDKWLTDWKNFPLNQKFGFQGEAGYELAKGYQCLLQDAKRVRRTS